MNAPVTRWIPTLLIGLALGGPSLAQGQGLDLPRPSPEATLHQRVGFTDIAITYSRPGVKGREVFGRLEPYGVVWRTGANSATKITFSTPVKFGGVDVPAGTYALFSIPEQSEWTVILNRASGQWGSYQYDAKNDIARVKTTAVKLAQPVETFTIDINDIRDDSASLDLIWQNTRVPVRLQFDVVPTVVKQIQAAMAAPQPPPWNVYDAAAQFYLDHDLDLKQAAAWAATAVEKQPAFFTYYHQARVLAKTGDRDAAIAAAKKSIELAAQGNNEVAKNEYTRLNQTLIASLGQ